MTRQLYDLAGADPAIRFSPYCWRTKLALAHKNLAFQTIPWRFTDKQEIAFTGQTEVPVLVDGEEVVHESQAIAEYLEARYPNEAALFGGGGVSRALTSFIRNWTDNTLHPAIGKIIALDLFKLLAPKDKDYYRESREARFGMTLEALAAQRETHLPAFRAALVPLRHTLREKPFIAGAAPAYADHLVFGALQWARLASATPLLEPDDAITLWMRSVLETYGLA